MTPAVADETRPTRRSWRRLVLRVALLLACCYVGVIVVLVALERRLLFHPARADKFWAEPPPAIRAEDVWLEPGDGNRIHAWWCAPEGWGPSQGAALYAHGNAGNLSHRGEAVRRWHERVGTAVLIFDYPGYGKSSGKPSEAGCHAAADAAYDWMVREKGVAAEDIILFGGSLGGGVAFELATRRPYRAVVVVSAFTSVPDMAARLYPWLPLRPFVRNRFENLAKIGRCQGRVFIAHGTADRTIPFVMGERLYAAAPEPKQFFPMPGYDHNHTPGPEFYEAFNHFLKEVDTSRASGGR